MGSDYITRDQAPALDTTAAGLPIAADELVVGNTVAVPRPGQVQVDHGSPVYVDTVHYDYASYVYAGRAVAAAIL
jgi:hypothetical protein